LKKNSRGHRRIPISAIIGPILLIGTAIVQATLSPYMKINGVHPDLVLLLVIGWTVLRGLEDGATWALIGGVSLDFLSGAPFGVFSLSLLLVAVITGFFHGRTFGSSIVVPLILTFPLSLVFNGMALILLNLLGHPMVWSDAVYNVMTPAAIFNTGVMMLVFPPLYLLNRWLNPKVLTL
jgi:rod shape-determining protein MreD